MHRFACIVAVLLTASCGKNQLPVETGTANETLKLEESIAWIEAGELSKGIRSLEELQGTSEPDVRLEALRWLGHAHTRNMDPQAALTSYREALLLDRGDAWLHYVTGTALFTLGDLEDAIASYTSALAIDDTHVKSLQWRGYSQTLLERYEKAAADFERAIALLESATPEALADWGGDRDEMLQWTRRELDAVNGALKSSNSSQR